MLHIPICLFLLQKKGKIEVDEYDTRLAELEKHDLKLNKHKEDIIQKKKAIAQDKILLLDFTREIDYNVFKKINV